MAIEMASSSFSLNKTIENIGLSGKLTSSGRVNKYDGHFLECDGFPANLGSICSVATSDGAETLAEIIGFKKGNNILSMFESDTKIQSPSDTDIKINGTSSVILSQSSSSLNEDVSIFLNNNSYLSADGEVSLDSINCSSGSRVSLGSSTTIKNLDSDCTD